MNAIEILQAAGEYEPELIEKTAKALYVLENTDPEGAEDLKNEIDAILTFTQEKSAAAASPGMKAFGAAVAGTLASGFAAAVATDLYDAARRGLTKSRNFKAIMAANPELQKYDKTQVRRAYDAVHRYAPEFTSDPMMGGSLLVNLSQQMPGSEHNLLSQVIRTRKELQESTHKQYSPGNTSFMLADKMMSASSPRKP